MMNRYNQTQKIMEHLVLINKSPHKVKNKKHLMIVFTGTNTGLDETIGEFKTLKSKGCTFDIAVSRSGEKILDMKEINGQLSPQKVYTENNSFSKTDFMKGIDGVLVPMLTQNTAIKLALGIQDQLIPRLLWQALWEGKPVWMNLDGLLQHKGLPASHTFMVKQIKETIEKLEKMKVKPLKKPFNIEEQLQSNTNISKEFYKEEQQVNTGRFVITEKDVLNFSPSNREMIVPRGSIITPLARDTAKERGIKIIEE